MKFIFTILLCFIFSFISYGQFNSNKIFKAVWVDFTKDGDVNFKVNFELDIDTINISKFDYNDSILYNLKEQINIDYDLLEKKIRDSISNIYFVQKELQNKNEYNGVLKFFATNNDMPYAIYKLKYGQENFIKEYFPDNNFENTQRAEKFKSIIGTFWSCFEEGVCLEIKSDKILIEYSYYSPEKSEFEYEIVNDSIKIFRDKITNNQEILNIQKLKNGILVLKSQGYKSYDGALYEKVKNFSVAQINFNDYLNKRKNKESDEIIKLSKIVNKPNFKIYNVGKYQIRYSKEAKLNWENALKLSYDFEQITKDWRLPTIEELKEIYTLKKSLGIDDGEFWSSSSWGSLGMLDYLDFSNGKNTAATVGNRFFILISKNNVKNSVSKCPPGDMRILDKQIQGTARKYQANDGHYYYQVILWVRLSELQKKYYSYLKYSAYGATSMDEVNKSIGEKMVINKVLENTKFSVMPELKCVVNQFVFGTIYFRDLKQIN